MKKWKVGYECRQAGADGIFYVSPFVEIIEAESKEDAVRKSTLFDVLHAQGYETRFPIVAEATENDLERWQAVAQDRRPSPEADEHSNHGLY